MIRLLLCSTLVFFVGVNADDKDGGPVVHTTSGDIHGKLVSDNHVEAYLGIPYADAPVGERRFAPPHAYHKEGVIEATALGHSCPQFTTGFEDDIPFHHGPEGEEEDCLNLNVWTPHDRHEKLPVLVFIHGGIALSTGSANEPHYDGASLANSQKIVVVGINYRLAELGLFGLDLPDAPGNVGIMDQTLALKWVQDNIEHFGGDPKRVTLFGETSGATSVGLHMLIPSGKGLFQQAIFLDGFPNIVDLVITKDEAKVLSHNLSLAAGCPDPYIDQPAALECLRGKPLSELINATIKGLLSDFKIFLPVLDGEIIPDRPEVLMKSGNICHHVNVMVGTSYHRTYLETNYYLHLPTNEEHNVTQADLRKLIALLFKDEYEFLQKIIEFHYTDAKHTDCPKAIRHEVIDLPNDIYNLCPAQELSDELVKSGNNVYRYHIHFHKEAATYPKWAGNMENEQFDLIFGHATTDKHYTEQEHQLSEEVMGYFGRFIKTGNPNKEGHHDWPKHNIRHKGYFRIQPGHEGGGIAQEHLRTNQCAFWLKGFPNAKHASKIMQSKICH